MARTTSPQGPASGGDALPDRTARSGEPTTADQPIRRPPGRKRVYAPLGGPSRARSPHGASPR